MSVSGVAKWYAAACHHILIIDASKKEEKTTKKDIQKVRRSQLGEGAM